MLQQGKKESLPQAKTDSLHEASINSAREADSNEPTIKHLASASVVFNRWLTYAQAAALIGIAVAGVVGIGQAIWAMLDSKAVSLGDLLMLFLYIEILSMVKGAAFGTHEIPIHTPIALAIVAVARYIVVDVEHISPNYMLFTSLSILVLVLALWLVRRTPYHGEFLQ